MVAGGSALARDADGQVVFVDGALPGERVRVAVDTERGLLLIKGAVPGPKGALVLVRTATKGR